MIVGLVEVAEAGLFHPTVLAATSTGLLALVGVGLSRTRTELRKGRTAAEDAREAIVNSHDTNIRDDLDDLHSDVRVLVKQAETNEKVVQALLAGLNLLRAEVQTERTDRMQDIDDLRKRVNRG